MAPKVEFSLSAFPVHTTCFGCYYSSCVIFFPCAAQEAGHPDEDELYETALLETNIVYELQGSELIPLEKYWGCIPRIEMLDPSKVNVCCNYHTSENGFIQCI